MSSPGTRTWPRWADPVIAGVVVAIAVVEIVLTEESVPVGQLAAAVVMGGALAWRRRAPVTVLLVVMGALTAQLATAVALNYLYLGLTLYPAYYSVGAHRRLRPAAAGLGLGLGLLALGGVVERLPVGEYLFPAILATAAWSFGAVLRARIAAAVEAEHRARDAEEQQEQRAATAVAEERARIARELHDLVAHSVSVMVMQAGALRRMLPPDRSRERGVASTVEHTGREALVEMRRMLGLLRGADAEGVPLAPQPGLVRIDELVERTQAAGVPVELEVGEPPGLLPPGLDLCVYRIVQESLTNVIKHAGPATVRVRVRFPPGRVELDIVDDGRGGPMSSENGHGVVGMRERVALFGGGIEAGPEAAGGFAVRARLPLEAR